MSACTSSLAIRENHGERASTRIVFLITGIVMSAWAPLVPLVKARTGLDEGGLGLLLLGFGIGSIVAMPFVGYLTARFGCRPVIIASTVVLSLIHI